jgi:ferredoxin
VTVRENQSIVQALAGAGVKVETMCQQGICGTCICTVLDGIPDHRDSFLTDAEREENREMLICCSRAKSSRLVLDL